MIQGLSHVMLYATDLHRAVAWYRETLGFAPDFVAGDEYASLRRTGCRIDLHATAAEIPGNGPALYFACDDLDAEVAALRAKGIDVEGPRSEGGSARFAQFRDSEGNALGLEQSPA